ncbi:CASP-like protein 1D1 isoform X3 [Hevea brasiliensis]|uniref:CASP-like protein 1D1 isoform X3 n=1 Tax=Hevea brasiliensis TaxID=3981 RepID=UPI0025EAB586|nr:CASP-like protein 1D1 isoform X3 [Hevea brasiliensis]
MASTGTDKPDPEAATKSEVPHPPPKGIDYFAVDVGLRVLLFAATLTAVVVMSTAKQTEPVFVPGAPVRVPIAAKFNHSPAFIYFVAALSVACLYSIITALASLGVIAKPIYATKFLLHYAFWDVGYGYHELERCYNGAVDSGNSSGSNRCSRWSSIYWVEGEQPHTMDEGLQCL